MACSCKLYDTFYVELLKETQKHYTLLQVFKLCLFFANNVASLSAIQSGAWHFLSNSNRFEPHNVPHLRIYSTASSIYNVNIHLYYSKHIKPFFSRTHIKPFDCAIGSKLEDLPKNSAFIPQVIFVGWQFATASSLFANKKQWQSVDVFYITSKCKQFNKQKQSKAFFTVHHSNQYEYGMMIHCRM